MTTSCRTFDCCINGSALQTPLFTFYANQTSLLFPLTWLTRWPANPSPSKKLPHPARSNMLLPLHSTVGHVCRHPRLPCFVCGSRSIAAITLPSLSAAASSPSSNTRGEVHEHHPLSTLIFTPNFSFTSYSQYLLAILIG